MLGCSDPRCPPPLVRRARFSAGHGAPAHDGVGASGAQNGRRSSGLSGAHEGRQRPQDRTAAASCPSPSGTCQDGCPHEPPWRPNRHLTRLPPERIRVARGDRDRTLSSLTRPVLTFSFSLPFLLFQLISIDELDNTEVLFSFLFHVLCCPVHTPPPARPGACPTPVCPCECSRPRVCLSAPRPSASRPSPEIPWESRAPSRAGAGSRSLPGIPTRSWLALAFRLPETRRGRHPKELSSFL